MLRNTESIAELPEYMEKSGILSASGVTDMGQTLAHNGDDMVIIQAVKDAFAFPAGLDQVGIAQQPELMGHRRLGHAQGLVEVIDAQFLFQQGGNDVQTAVVREDLEHFAEPFQFRIRGHLAEDRPGFRQGSGIPESAAESLTFPRFICMISINLP